MSMRYPGGFIASTPVTAAYPSGVWTQAQAIPYQAQNVWTRDQYWPYTTLLLQGNGTNGAQNNTFLDSSTNNFTITRNGNTTQGSFTPYEANGYWSNYFNGGANHLSVAAASAIDLASSDFTIECWALPGTRTNVIDAVFGYGLYTTMLFRNDTTWSWEVGNGSSANYFTITAPCTPNVWQHIALTRSGNTFTFWLNGVSVGTNSTANAVGTASKTLSVGFNGVPAAQYFTGYISNFRIVKGTAVYQSAFTPSTAPLTAITNTSLLTCQSNRFIDNSTNAFTITLVGSPSVQAFQPFPGATTYSGTVLGGSGYFDGSGDYLTAPSNAVFDFGTGDFTIEAWGYRTSSGAYGFLISRRAADFNFGPFSLGVDGSNVPYFACSSSGSSWIFVLTGSALPLNTWFHLAGVRNGNTFALYVNGVSVGTASSSASLMASSVAACIGAHANGSEPFAGYIANPRIVKGTAVYTSTFTPPTAPLTAITNTSLLLNFTNAGIFDAAAMNDLETVGNAQVSTSVVKYGTGSMAFDGSGDWLIAPSTQQLSFSTGDFTVEMWVYATSVGGGTERFLFDTRAASADAGLAIYISTTGVLSVTSSDAVRATGGTITANSWIHVAVVRSSGAITVFLNGIPGSASSYSSSITCPGSVRVGIKTDGTTPYVGYIDDLRVTKGAARYITNFTPPPARMPGQ